MALFRMAQFGLRRPTVCPDICLLIGEAVWKRCDESLLVEAFKHPYNVSILICIKNALTKTTIFLGPGGGHQSL